jgi:Fe2+ or Zn2+ uptake regulation protein
MEQLEIFFNTTDLKEDHLRQREIKAGTQNEKILSYFQQNQGKIYTPFQVQEALNLHNVPITSIRRAITTLTDLGYLTMTHIMMEGKYGMNNHTWKLNQ